MQRYRINYHWLIGVFVSSFVLAVVAFFVHRWQVERKAGFFLSNAEAALAVDDPMEAFKQFQNYVALRPDENEPRVKMANAALKVAKSSETSMEELVWALGTIEQTVRTTDDAELRRELAELMMLFRRPQDALGHVEDLLAISPDDSELNALRIRALFQAKEFDRLKARAFGLIGYDQKKDEFDTAKVTLKDQPDVYSLLADVLLQRDKNEDLAQRVVDKMIEANPNSAQAYLRKASFLLGQDEKEQAQEFLDQAYELDSKDAAILSLKGRMALIASYPEDAKAELELSEEEKAKLEDERKASAEEARSYFAIGLQEHPDNFLFYRLVAQALQRLEKRDEALKILDQGIKHFERSRSVELVIDKVEMLFAEEDYPAINDEIESLVRLNQPSLMPLIDFQKARILFGKQKWAEAGKQLRRIRPLLFDQPKFQSHAGTMLGVCYENQGMADLALQAYTEVLNDFPKNARALSGFKRMQARLNPNQRGIELDDVVRKTLELPKAEQDWAKVEELIDEVAEERNLPPAREMLIRAKVLMKREMFDEAKVLIRQAAKEAPEDIDIHFTAVLLVLSDPNQGPAAAVKLLDRLEDKWGVSIRSIAQRADLISRMKPEDASAQLRALLTAKEDFTEAETLQLYKILGLSFEQLGMVNEAREFYEKTAAQEPSNFPIRMRLFDLALRQQDDLAMRKAQEGILEFVKSEDDASYILTEVRRRIIGFSLQEISKEELVESTALLDKALLQRPKWHELHITYGQLLLVLRRDINLALEHFDKALDSGPAKSNAVSVQVKLLFEQGLFEKARERMELLPREVRGRVLGRFEADVLAKTGDEETAFEVAKELAQNQPNNASTQFWFSKLAQDIGKLEDASTALRKALQIDPSSPDNWLRIIGLYAEQKKFDDVRDVIREAHIYTDAEFLPLLTGKYYELISKWQIAEAIYLSAYAGQDQNLAIAHRMADFYLLWSAKDQANIRKAATFINRILKAANQGQAAADNPHVVWARQKAARILQVEGDYQKSLQAERLLRQSAVNSQMSREESDLLADILIARNEPKSLMAARQLLLELRNSGRLTKKGGLQLARILSSTGEWEASRDLMLDILPQYASDPGVQQLYIELLIEHGEYSSADKRIKRLRKMDPKNTLLVQLSARLASEQGDQAELERILRANLPSLKGAMSEQQLQGVFAVAQLSERYGAYELAEELYRQYVRRLPGKELELARFLALHGDCEEAITIMKRQFDDNIDQVIQLATRMVAVRRAEIGDKFNDDIDRFISRSLRDDPDSLSRMLIRAEAFEAQGRNKESIEVYDKLLTRDDMPIRMRAAAMNNLGFQLGLLSQRVDEAEQMINDAMVTFGPVADMLDTRAIVRIAQQKYDLAIEDMELATSVSQDPVKYFHMAKACILAGDGPAAMKAWEKAQELGFDKEALPILEKPSFDQILQQIESFQSQNAKL